MHSKYSFDGAKDGTAEIDVIVKTAIERGLSEIAICDHCDIDDILDGIYEPYPKDEIRADILAAKKKYSGKIKINYGIELGEPHVRPDEATALIDECGFDFVIGSLHNLRGYPDFAFLRYTEMTPEHIDWLARRNISELCEIARFPKIDTLAHITYMGRYFANDGIDYDFMKHETAWRELFHIIIENGIALEVNTSCLRKASIPEGKRKFMPDADLLRLYFDCSGTRLTLGSDAHTAKDIAAGFEEAGQMISKQIG